MSLLITYGTFIGTLVLLLCALFCVLLLGLPVVVAIRPVETIRRSALLWGVAVGLTIYGTALALLGFAGLYAPATCAVLLLSGPLLNIRRGKEVAEVVRGSIEPLKPAAGDLPAILAIAAFALAILPAVIAPEIFYDALYYHLGLPSQYLLNGRISLFPDVVHGAFPATLDLVFGAALAIGGTTASKGLGFLLFLLAIAATGELGRCMADRSGEGEGWKAAAILATVPGVAIMASLTSVDVGMAFAAALAWIGLLESRQVEPSEAWRPLLLSAFPLGLAAGSKYTGLYLVAALAPIVLVGPPGMPFRKRLLSACAMAGGALLICSPWYIRNAIAFGNPVYPALSAFLGGGEGGIHAMEHLSRDLPKYGIGDFPALLRALLSGTLGAGADLGILLPFAFVSLAAIGIIRKRTLPAIAAAALFLAMWGIGPKATRYLFPLFPLVAAGGGVALTIAASRNRKWMAAAGVLILAGAAFNVYRLAQVEQFLFNPRGKLVSLLKGEVSREEYLASLLPHTAIAKWANENLPKDAVILFVGETRPLYFERTVVFASAYDRSRLLGWISESGDGDILTARLRREGITHVIVNGPELARLQKDFGYLDVPEADFRKVKAFIGKTRLLHSAGGCRLSALP